MTLKLSQGKNMIRNSAENQLLNFLNSISWTPCSQYGLLQELKFNNGKSRFMFIFIDYAFGAKISTIGFLLNNQDIWKTLSGVILSPDLNENVKRTSRVTRPLWNCMLCLCLVYLYVHKHSWLVLHTKSWWFLGAVYRDLLSPISGKLT